MSIAAITPSDSNDAEIFYDEMSRAPSISYNKKDYMSRINTGYNKEHVLKEFNWNLDTTYEELAVEELQYKLQYDFETILIYESDAVNYGLERYKLSYQPQAEIKVNMLTPIDFKMLGNVIFHYSANGRERFPNARWRVTNIDRINHTATLKYIEEYTP